MKKLTLLLSVLLVGAITSCQHNKIIGTINSPSGDIRLDVIKTISGKLEYRVFYKNNLIIKESSLGFDFKDSPSISDDLSVDSIKTYSYHESWETAWGEQRFIEDNYNALQIFIHEDNGNNRRFFLSFRTYNDGIGFRYEFPDQKNFKDVIILDENTQFNLTGNHLCWWIPGDWDIYEHLYKTTRFNKIDAVNNKSKTGLAQTYIPENAVNTPFTVKTDEGVYLSFHEAAVTNYSGMTLKIDTVNYSMQTELVGSAGGYKVKTSTPFNTPWRMIIIVDKPGDLNQSKLMLNLNEPNKIGDASFFKPMKYVGIWWEMHIGKSSWDMASGKHGATTKNAKRYIDFAAENNIGGILVEGWNTGWEHWIGFPDREGIFDFVTPYSDYILKEVVNYANKRGVKLIMHHETSAAVRTYEQQLDTAFSLMKSLGLHAVKTGYVGEIIPKGEYHQGQWMVNHYRKVIETAAKYQIAVDAHEPFKGTGEWRTYPNAISREDFRGQEFNAWSTDGGNPPEHITITAFTAQLAGPMDYTPGIFNIKLKPYKPDNQVNTTLTHQLALYVVIYSPIQMVADLPENYQNHPAFQFIRDVGVDWDTSLVLNGEIGDYITIARKERATDKWFIGSITDEKPRELTIDLKFLDKNKSYLATIYSDGKNAHWDYNPTDYQIKKLKVNSNSQINITLAAGGGTAISILPI